VNLSTTEDDARGDSAEDLREVDGVVGLRTDPPVDHGCDREQIEDVLANVPDLRMAVVLQALDEEVELLAHRPALVGPLKHSDLRQILQLQCHMRATVSREI
jgi:hypothetical protein